MANWHQKLPQSQKILLTAVHCRVTVTELAVLTVLVNMPDYRIRWLSSLWDPAGGDVRALPYTRQGIEKAVKALVKKGWLHRENYQTWNDPARLNPISILCGAPVWMRADKTLVAKKSSAEAKTATPVASGSTLNAEARKRLEGGKHA